MVVSLDILELSFKYNTDKTKIKGLNTIQDNLHIHKLLSTGKNPWILVGIQPRQDAKAFHIFFLVLAC